MNRYQHWPLRILRFVRRLLGTEQLNDRAEQILCQLESVVLLGRRDVQGLQLDREERRPSVAFALPKPATPEHGRHCYVLLGEPIRESLLTHPDVYQYVYRPQGSSTPCMLAERDYLDERLFRISSEHWAEFGAMYVFYHHNPLGLRDEDTFALLSSRKFEAKCLLSFRDVLALDRRVYRVLQEPNSVLSFRPYPERDLHRPDAASFFDPEHFNTPECIRLAQRQGLRCSFTNYPNVWRNYFAFSYRTFREFFQWCHEHLFQLMFDADGNPREEVIRRLASRKTSYVSYRIFGLFLEFFYHKFFFDRQSPHYVLDRWSQLYRLRYTNANLDWVLEYVGDVGSRYDVVGIDQWVRRSRTEDVGLVIWGERKDLAQLFAETRVGEGQVLGVCTGETAPADETFCGHPLITAEAIPTLSRPVAVLCTSGRARAMAEGLKRAHPQRVEIIPI